MRTFLLVKMFAAAAAACVLTACANTKTLPRLNQDDRNSLRKIGVITVGPAVGSMTGGAEAAAQGALQGAVGGSLAGLGAASACGPTVVLCGILFVPAGVVLGGAGGAIFNAIPESMAAEIRAALIKAIADRDLQAGLRRGVLQYAVSAGAGADLGAGAMVPASSPSYASLAGNGIGAVLEISLTHLALEQKTVDASQPVGSYPRLSLVMTARARMVRVRDGSVLWNASEVTYESLAAQGATWTARDSDLMKTEIANGTEALARQIRVAVFGAHGRIEAGPNNAPPSVRYLP